MRNSKFEIRNQKGRNRGSGPRGLQGLEFRPLRAERAKTLELLIPNFEFFHLGKNSKFEIRNPKGRNRGLGPRGWQGLEIPPLRAERANHFELLISNFEFPPRTPRPQCQEKYP